MVNLTLEQIIQSKPLSLLFLSYLKKIHATEELEFWLEIELFKRVSECMECMKEAKRIHARFLSDQSFSEINIAGDLREEIHDKMESNLWDQRLFDNAQKSVYEALNFTCVRSFCAETKLSMTVRKRESLNLSSTLYQLVEKYQELTKAEQKEREKNLKLLPRIAYRLVKKSSSLRGKKDKANPAFLRDLGFSSGSNSESEEYVAEKKRKNNNKRTSSSSEEGQEEDEEKDSPRSLGRPKSLTRIFAVSPVGSPVTKEYDTPCNLRKSASAPFYVQYEHR